MKREVSTLASSDTGKEKGRGERVSGQDGQTGGPDIGGELEEMEPGQAPLEWDSIFEAADEYKQAKASRTPAEEAAEAATPAETPERASEQGSQAGQSPSAGKRVRRTADARLAARRKKTAALQQEIKDLEAQIRERDRKRLTQTKIIMGGEVGRLLGDPSHPAHGAALQILAVVEKELERRIESAKERGKPRIRAVLELMRGWRMSE